MYLRAAQKIAGVAEAGAGSYSHTPGGGIQRSVAHLRHGKRSLTLRVVNTGKMLVRGGRYSQGFSVVRTCRRVAVQGRACGLAVFRGRSHEHRQ